MGKEKCHFCPVCNGLGCLGEMPGMGGPFKNRNFILNCSDWDKEVSLIERKLKAGIAVLEQEDRCAKIRLAPMTGAVENVGYADEKSFYFDLINACCKADVLLGIGDGVPDCKLQYGIEAVETSKKKAAVFIKPYPDQKIFERIEWSSSVAEYCGIDIDSSNIATMRNLVHLERKSAAQLLRVKQKLNSLGIPFVIKGIFLPQDIELVKEVRPDVIFISNHGGRVETREGSTVSFLKENASVLKSNCNELWIDGGIRTRSHVLAALYLGADSVLLGRPFATALCRSGEEGVVNLAKKLTNAL